MEVTGVAAMADRGGRRALRRRAAAGLAGDLPGAGHRRAAARRADDLPRPALPGRDPRPGPRPRRRARRRRRRRAARPRPGGRGRRPRRAARRGPVVGAGPPAEVLDRRRRSPRPTASASRCAARRAHRSACTTRPVGRHTTCRPSTRVHWRARDHPAPITTQRNVPQCAPPPRRTAPPPRLRRGPSLAAGCLRHHRARLPTPATTAGRRRRGCGPVTVTDDRGKPSPWPPRPAGRRPRVGR